jgi:hypothetical protein
MVQPEKCHQLGRRRLKAKVGISTEWALKAAWAIICKVPPLSAPSVESLFCNEPSPSDDCVIGCVNYDKSLPLMASKKNRGKPCAYCAVAVATTADHVFARGFFPTAQRAHLPTVPACLACNHAKSELEHYLAALLPFGGRQAGSAEHLEQMIPPRLAKNAALHRALNEGKKKVWTREPTGIAPTTALPLDGEKLEELFVYITKGLMLHEWQTLVRPDTIVQAASLTSHGRHCSRATSRVRRPGGSAAELAAASLPMKAHKAATVIRSRSGLSGPMAA